MAISGLPTPEKYDHYMATICAICRSYIGHIWAMHKLDHNKYEEWGGGGFAAAPHFLDIGYGPSVACTVGCTWLMYSLCMAHIWPMYDLYMAMAIDTI